MFIQMLCTWNAKQCSLNGNRKWNVRYLDYFIFITLNNFSTILQDGWTTSWTTAWRCGKEMGILLHYFPRKKIEILHQERRGQVNTIVMEYFNRWINWFTSLCKNLFNLLEFLAEAFRCHVHHFQCLTVPVDELFNCCFNYEDIIVFLSLFNCNIFSDKLVT